MWCFLAPLHFFILKPFDKLSRRLPVSLQRFNYIIQSHYVRYYGLPMEKAFVPKTDKNIIFLPHMRWNNMKQRPHHLARAFSNAGWTVFYLTHDIDDNVKGIKEINERLFLCSRVRLLKEIKNPWIYMSYTVNMYYLNFFKEYSLIYDYFDKLEVNIFFTKKMVHEHQKALKTAKIVLASSCSLREEIANVRSDTILIPNAVFPEDFMINSDVPVPADMLKILEQGKPIFGYYGIFSRWKIDYGLIRFIAWELPDFNFVMIGPGDIYDESLNEYEWDHFPNIYFLGMKKYNELPYYAVHFNVALLPLMVNEITNAISPVKLFEYLAMKLPVVSTNIVECRKYQSVLIAGGHEDFTDQLRKAILLKNDPAWQALVQKELASNTWDYHCQTILKQMTENK